MTEPNVVKQEGQPLEDEKPAEKVQEALVSEVAEDARRAPEQWLRDAEVPKGGE